MYIYKVIIFVCLSDHNSGTIWTDLPKVLIGELGRPTGMFNFEILS